MGKDQELLDAARSGNVAVVDKILSQRAKRSGPLASLRRGPGANVQDSNGYTPLHHAALNGHKEIVRLLLASDASPSLAGGSGATPLHLASWAGHADIVRALLAHPAPPHVDQITKDNETALQMAAQYGHTAVVAQLLSRGADPAVRNVRDESALDLAAQYGRLETVEMLVRTHPELLEAYRLPGARSRLYEHTPLHRASRNGHKEVVCVLAAAGVDVNARTAAGTSLHEAALCGKARVVHALLARGADPSLPDGRGRTPLDLLRVLPAHATKHIVNAINKHRLSNGYDSESEDLPAVPLGEPGSPYDNVRPFPSGAPGGLSPSQLWEPRDEDRRRTSAVSIGTDYSHQKYYQMDGSYNGEADRASISSTASSTGGAGSREPRQRCGTSDSSVSGGHGGYFSAAPGYHAHSPGSNNKVSPTPPKKPPRRNLSVSPTHGGGTAAQYLARAGHARSQDDLDDYPTGKQSLRHGRSVDQYVDIKSDSQTSPSMKPTPNPRPSLMNRNQPVAISAMYENVVIKTQNPKRKLRRNQGHQYENYEPRGVTSDENGHRRYASSQERSSMESLLDDYGSGNTPSDGETVGYGRIQTPLSPTHYQQPPTPDHPPPSATQAEHSIHERIRPLSQVSI